MRLEDWPDRMAQAVARHAAMPFGWGASDCFTLPMDVVLAMTGADPWADERGYATAAEAAARLKAKGYTTIADAFAAKFAEVPPSFARRGDIGVADYPGALMGGGVVVLGATVIGKSEAGTLRLPRTTLKRAFRVD